MIKQSVRNMSGNILTGVKTQIKEHKARSVMILAAAATIGVVGYNLATSHNNESVHAAGPTGPTPAEEYNIAAPSVDCVQKVEQHDGNNSRIISQTVNGKTEYAVKQEPLSGLPVNSSYSQNSNVLSQAVSPALGPQGSTSPDSAKATVELYNCLSEQYDDQSMVKTGEVTIIGENGQPTEIKDLSNNTWMMTDDGTGRDINADYAKMSSYTFADAYNATQKANKENTIISRTNAKKVAVVQPQVIGGNAYYVTDPNSEYNVGNNTMTSLVASNTPEDPLQSLVLEPNTGKVPLACGQEKSELAFNVVGGNAFVTQESTGICETTPSTPSTPSTPGTSPSTPHTPPKNTPSCVPGKDVECTPKVDTHTSVPGPDPNGTHDLIPGPTTPATPDNGSENPVGGVTSNNTAPSNSGSSSSNTGSGNTSGNTPPQNAGGGTPTNPTSGNVPTPGF